jgi:predicted esterase
VLGTLTIAAAVAVVPLARAEGPPTAAATRPDAGPLISGTSSYVRGTFVWTDYAYDDRGADTNLIRGGDAKYPARIAGGNAADIIQLQLGLDGGSLKTRVILERLTEPGTPSVGIGFDTDSNAATGAATLPGTGWKAKGALGLERVAVLTAPTGRLLAWQGGRWVQTATFPVAADLEENTLDATVAALAPGGAKWRAVAAAGLRAPDWTTGAGGIYDLAFVRGEDPYKESVYAVPDAVHQVALGGTTEWQDKRQAEILGGVRASSNAVALIDFAKVAAGHTRLATASTVGYHTLLYRSPVKLTEGFSGAGDVHFGGRYQPYVLRMSTKVPPTSPGLVVYLHGADQNHLQNEHFYTDSVTDVISPGYFDPPALVVFLLGRDNAWGSAASEREVLDVIADVSTRYGVDPDRVVLTGISAGGFGSFRIGARYPDRFAGIYSLVGGGSSEPLENLRNLPTRALNGLLDPLVNVQIYRATADALDALGTVDYRAWLANIRSHVGTPALGNCVLLELLARGRVINPPQVTFTAEPEDFVDDPITGLSVRPDGAYWVSAMDPRGTGPATVDAISEARSDRNRTGTDLQGVYENITAGRDFCGPNADVRTGDSWEERGRRIVPGAPAPTANRLVVRAKALAGVTVDTARASLAVTAPLEVVGTSDGPTSLRLAGPWAGPVSLTVDGVAAGTLTPSAGQIVLPMGAGTHSYVLAA